MKTYKTLLNEFLEFEKTNDLYEFTIEGIPVWQLIRFKVFLQIKESYFGNKENNSRPLPSNLFSAFINFCKHLPFHNPFLIKQKVDILILNHPRRKKVNNFYLDQYTDPLVPKIESSFIVLERFHNFSHLRPTRTNNLYYMDIIEFPYRMISFLPSNVKFAKSDMEKIKKIKNEIIKKWNIQNIDLEQDFIKTFKRAKFILPIIKRLLKKLGIKQVISVVSYIPINQLFTLAAKNLNIKTAELQHGTMGKYQIAYNYATNSSIKSFPDYFYSWGNYWTESTRLPVAKNNIKNIGFAYINQYRTLRTTYNNEKNILFLSQMRQDLAIFVAEVAKKQNDLKILFKAHPAEYGTAEKDYQFLSEIPNITIIADDKLELYNLFNTCDYVAGIFSTALIEATAFCPKIIIIKLPGWEYFEDLEENEHIIFVDDAESFLRIIKNNTTSEFTHETNQFFSSNLVNLRGIVYE